MLKNYTINFYLVLFFAFICHVKSSAQIRIVEVDPSSDRVKLHNYGGSTVNVSSYWLCSAFTYGSLGSMTILNGSLNLASNADVELTSSVNLNNSAADLGLYDMNTFGSSTAMKDFIQWGSGGNGREAVAVNKGIWVAGTFVNATPPYQYAGDGAQNGVQFWDTLLGIEEFATNQFKIIQNPSSSKLLLSLPRTSSLIILEVFDVLGKRILTKEISGVYPTVDVSKWNNGIYLVRLSADNVTQTKRFIKQ